MLSGILPWWTREPFFNFHRARYGKGEWPYIYWKSIEKFITLAGKSQILWFFQNHSRLAWALIWNSYRMLSGILPWWTGEPFFNFHRARYGKGERPYIYWKSIEKFITLAGKSQILWFFQNHSRLAWALIWNSYRMLSGILPWWTREPFFNFHRARYGKGGGHIYTEKALKNS